MKSERELMNVAATCATNKASERAEAEWQGEMPHTHKVQTVTRRRTIIDLLREQSGTRTLAPTERIRHARDALRFTCSLTDGLRVMGAMTAYYRGGTPNCGIDMDAATYLMSDIAEIACCLATSADEALGRIEGEG